MSPSIAFSAHHYTTDDLENAKYSYQMEYRDDITFNIDMQQTGVGGDDSWGARTHDEYTLWPGPLSYSYPIAVADCVRPAGHGDRSVHSMKQRPSRRVASDETKEEG